MIFKSESINKIALFTLLLVTFKCYSQNELKIYKASFAEFPPTEAAKQRSYRYSYAELKENFPFFLHEKALDQPVPTNDWWTNAIFSKYAGDMWAYPHSVSADSSGIKIVYPDGFDEGKLRKSNFLELTASVGEKFEKFKAHSAKPMVWGDLNMTFRCEDSLNHYMDVSISHGSPFVWVELNGIKPVLQLSNSPQFFTTNGHTIKSFPVLQNVFSIKIGNKFYGIHAPKGTILEKRNNNYLISTPDTKNYIVISLLPNQSFLQEFDVYARNKISNTIFDYSYKIEQGDISTSFVIATKNLESKETGDHTIMAFQPHHYRTTTTNAKFIDGANYTIHTGLMKCAIGKEFTFNYAFTGLPPYLGKPQSMTSEQNDRLYEMIDNFQTSRYGEDTYNKVLDELSEIMLIAKQTEHPKYEEIKSRLKKELINWLTYDMVNEADQAGKYFAKYPEYGALIGFPAGYDSQAFNDQHFHYGYFVLAASRLMMVDDEFKTNYAEMVKLIAKNYANWQRWSGNDHVQKLPYLRTFDPYAGHSWASGMSYETGPDQESTSEAIMSWFGLFNLGIVLNDTNLIALGAMGYTLESEVTLDYYFNLYGNSFPDTYKYKYVGILHAGAIMHDTWFSKDPAWIFGIQSVPSAHYCSYLARDEKQAETILLSSIQNRINGGFIETHDLYSNIISMGPQLGYYFLGNYANFKPEEALKLQEQIFENEDDKWKWPSQATINYYLTNATITYGKPLKNYHTSLPMGAVYKNNNGDITYLVYNHTKTDKKVVIYKNNKVIDKIEVKAEEFYCKVAN